MRDVYYFEGVGCVYLDRIAGLDEVITDGVSFGVLVLDTGHRVPTSTAHRDCVLALGMVQDLEDE